jgi:hypothetical protein
MSLVLYPRAAPSDRLRIWVGAFKRTQAPALSWFLNDAPANPHPLRPISSVRPDDMLPAGVSPAKVQRAFTGVYEFSGRTPDTFYRVRVNADGVNSPTLETRTLPDSVPTEIDRSFNVLLVSCFHQTEDRAGLASTIVSQLKATSKPHLTLLAGDQVYLDLPTLKNFPDDQAWLAEKFERDYTLNWSGPLAYTEVLASAPSISSPDDHEYWNNYPHPSPVIANSLSEGGRDRWQKAAQAMYDGFQLPYPAKVGEGVQIDVHPLSFFVADTRSGKHIDRKFTMSDDARDDLNSWVTDVIDKKRFGVFVSGQSLFGDAAGSLGGAVGDYELANYQDYDKIVKILKRLVDAGRPVLCLTGDVHWGRVSTTTDIRTGRIAFAEVISSPVSLVSTVGADQAKRVLSALGGLFGKKNPWPRHSDPATLPAFLASSVLAGGFPSSLVHGQRGNHAVMLSFRQQGDGLELRVKYWPISRDTQVGKPTEVRPIELLNA